MMMYMFDYDLLHYVMCDIFLCREFCNMVKKIFICSKEELKKMKCKLPNSSLEIEETLLSLDSHNRDENQQTHVI